jgi:hypothetical protein
MCRLLTRQQLAEATGLEMATTEQYCRRFAPYLEAQGSGLTKCWEPISIATLQIIHSLYQAGSTTTEIRRLLEAAVADLPAAVASAPPKDTAAESAEITARFTRLRSELRAAGCPSSGSVLRRLGRTDA